MADYRTGLLSLTIVRSKAGFCFSRLPTAPGPLVLIWILAWTVIFSGLDFWSIKIYGVQQYSWFQPYRVATEVGGSVVCPASLALAENVYFIWLNVFDTDRTLHEWEWYTGNPVNPDGSFDFIWGDGQGGWIKYPMWKWYGIWLPITLAWFAALAQARRRWRRVRGLMKVESTSRHAHTRSRSANIDVPKDLQRPRL
jgi:hypothetical protein